MLIFWLGATPSNAEGLDYSAGMLLRSLPLGAALSGQTGYGVLLWGKKEPGEFRYGFVRPSLRILASGLMNRIEGAVNLHPISFVGLQAGHSQSFRYTNPQNINCELTACRGRLGANWVRLNLLAGAGPLISGFTLRLTWFQPAGMNRPNSPFSEETSVLVGSAGVDRLVSKQGFFSYRLNPANQVGTYLYFDRMLGTQTSNTHLSFFLRHKPSDWDFTLGAGFYESDFQPRGFTAYALVQWTGVPSMELE